MLRFIFPKGLNIIRSYIVFLSVIGAIMRHVQPIRKLYSSKPAQTKHVQPIRKVSGFLGLRAESEANETQKEKRRTYFLREERTQKINNPFPKEIPLIPYLLEERK